MKKQALTIAAAALVAIGAMKAQCTFTITGISTSTMSGSPHLTFSAQTVGTVPGTAWYYWDFGDGNYGANPTGSVSVNMYCNAGVYTVNVIAVDSSVSSGTGCYTTYQTTINVASDPFSITGINVGNSDPVFNYTAVVNNPYNLSLNYQWDVDYPYGVILNGNPVNTQYSTNGVHNVNMNVSYSGCVKNYSTSVSVSNATFCFSTPSLVVNNNDPTFNFTLNANPMPSANSIYYWNFGDGTNIVTTSNTSSHTYTANGTYWMCAWVYDSTGICTYTSACQNIVVNNAALLPLSCNPVSFTAWADSANPQIWYYNYTPIQPSGGNPPYTITAYFWDFGDGNSSTAAFPSYTYAVPGAYTVCINITWKDANNDSCISTSCMQINRLINGGNANDNNVLSGNAKYLYPAITGVSISEKPIVKIYPNPVNEQLNINLNKAISGDVVIYDISGRMIVNSKVDNSMKTTLNITNLDKGIYILKIKDHLQNEIHSQTFIKE